MATDDTPVPAQQRREHADAIEGFRPVPWSVMTLIAALVATGLLYIAFAAPGAPSALGDGRSLAELRPALDVAGAINAGRAQDGATLFASRCAACHQAAGQGLPGVFPPLAGSEWAMGKDTTLAAILLHGINGSVSVNGTTYNGAMPAFKDQLPNGEIAAVLSHVRSHWGNIAPAVTAATVAAVREKTAARQQPFNGGAELATLP